jgi:hypothetical protein
MQAPNGLETPTKTRWNRAFRKANRAITLYGFVA